MKLLLWILSLPIFAAALVFALQNRMQVDISFWPFDLTVTLPLSVLSIGLLVVGFLCGAMTISLLHLGSFFEKRRLKKEIASLNSKLKEKDKAAPSFIGTFMPAPQPHKPIPSTQAHPTKFRSWFGRKR